jgi:hypothetical protein
LFVLADIYSWRILDEQAGCSYWLGNHAAAFALCRGLLAHPELPDDVRPRIAANRDYSAPTMLETALSYPDALVRNLIKDPRNTDVTVSLIAGPDRDAAEQTLNSFLHCCTDLARIGRFVVFDAGLTTQDREILHDSYPTLDIIESTHDQQRHIQERFWLQLGRNPHRRSPLHHRELTGGFFARPCRVEDLKCRRKTAGRAGSALCRPRRSGRTW